MAPDGFGRKRELSTTRVRDPGVKAVAILVNPDVAVRSCCGVIPRLRLLSPPPGRCGVGPCS